MCVSALTIDFTLDDCIRPPKSTFQDHDCDGTDGDDGDIAHGTVQYSFPELDGHHIHFQQMDK